ncbi:TIM barrel protein [Mangrovicoccus sp. HB161399]|uniref:TIM barrel protein n=1 Tax=Mangrovicoccus sp. HB161399 TaxID=2720392 RepID=UPI0015583044|nr:TIM barrel protein [Mangrovicoccus sp. HB161399]
MGFAVAVNRTCAPQMSFLDFLALARQAGATAVEIRNDMGGELDGQMPVSAVRAMLDTAGLRCAALNALQRFNDWTPERADEARQLIAQAAALGASGIVLCPVVDASAGWSPAEAHDRLCAGLSGLAPLFEGSGVKGLVEPLGMAGSTMKRQDAAVAAVEDAAGWRNFALCHDTFQYWRCGDDRMFPQHFGMVHVSGIARPDLEPGELDEPDRGLVFPGDRAGTIAQLRQILAAGYRGTVSFEPFDPEVQRDPRLANHLAASIDYVRLTATDPARAAS